jgi:hypothetical protein
MITADSALRHELAVSRLVTGIVQSRIMPSYFDLSKAVKVALADYEPTMNRKDFDALRRQVSLMVSEKMAAMWDGTTNDLFDLAKYEAGHVVGELSGATAVSEAAIAKAVNTPMVLAGAVSQVGTWREYVAGSTNSTQTRIIDNTIRAGYESGATVGEMTKRLVGTKANNYLDGLISNTGAREAEALVRTGANHYANVARDVAAQANADLIQGRVFLATFDNRTTLTCRHFGTLQKIYALDDPATPKPPLHFNCRSLLQIVPIGFDPFGGTKAAVGGNDTQTAEEAFNKKNDKLDARRAKADEQRAQGQDPKEVPSKVTYTGRKDSAIFDAGQINAKTNMDAWMRQQPDWFIESSLGKTRAKLFKEGGLSMDKFTDMNGRPLTLKEMKALDAYDFAFRKAKL